ncbi:hypothetical protein CIW83_18270 [Tissierella sp. P1]|uniref:hypothetical protein n=1 Tax=Tissierella sp. P1 TaxID=1280483 RepID=UPI000BA10FD8|nr:hypothetical protein [Tissierella sp. P1]OZV10765.1 hypothetical protein CIW83_18270 [Tissierella sp. P1]
MTNEQIESAIEYALQIATTGNEEEIETIIEALEKQIPKKGMPYNSGKNHNFIECSTCSAHLDLYYKHCTKCGQKLDWS